MVESAGLLMTAMRMGQFQCPRRGLVEESRDEESEGMKIYPVE
jgi:hypothetical protein